MAFSTHYRSWRNLAFSALKHEISDQLSEKQATIAAQPIQKMPVKAGRTLAYWIKNLRHAV